MKRFLLLGVATGLTVGAFASMQEEEREKWFAGKVGVYFPANQKIRSAMGSSWFSYGLGPSRYELKDRLSLNTDLNFISKSKNGNKVFIALPTIGATRAFAQEDSESRPFLTGRVGLAYLDYAIGAGVGRISKKKLGLSANLEGGFIVKKRVRLSARYDWISKSDGFGFDGLSLGITWQLGKY